MSKRIFRLPFMMELLLEKQGLLVMLVSFHSKLLLKE